MKKVITAAGLLSVAYALPAAAQSSVTIYGILDEAAQYSNVTNRGSVTQMLPIGNVPSRLGFLGSEDLGNGLSAVFRLEQGLALNSGNSVPQNRLFGRAAYVGLNSKTMGELRLGRDYALMQLELGKYDLDHLSSYSPALAAQQSNLDQTSQDNMIKYLTPTWNGFSAQATVSLRDRTGVAPGPGPQIIGAGSLHNAYGVMLAYDGESFEGGITFQTRGQNLNAGGEANQKLIAAAGIYKFSKVNVGAMFWQQRNDLSNGRTPVTNIWSVGTVWKVTPAFELVGQVGLGIDNGMTYATGATKAKGRNTWINLGANYSFSKRTTAYMRVGRVTDSDGGFNGRPNLAAPSMQTTPLPANGSARAVLVGLRQRF
ncbi:porin [Paraburkholderia sp. A2WS-5]|uniref:porin n=1 Tax=unclassified Paraburkholderia TaxID=2615204 RepID=UPI003B79FD38